MRIRKDENANYKAVFLDSGKTLRFKINPSLPFSNPKTPEILDIAINNKCNGGCSYCYTSALKSGVNFDNIIGKAEEIWGNLPEEERPFQIAIGGAGESTMHPEWCNFVKYIRSLNIIPNYTTNGMHIDDNILEYTEKYCGGVAISWHPHLFKYFYDSVDKFKKINTKLNFHVIVGDKLSLDHLKMLYKMYKDDVEYFVVLPYQAAGRAKAIETEETWKECFKWIESVQSEKFAFGALFYDFIKRSNTNLQMSVYEPEMFSGYVILNENYKTIYKSSYNLEPKL